MFGRLEQAVGAGKFAVVLLDMFLTVLYARMGTSLLAGPLARLTWRVVRAASAPLGWRRGVVLSFCGPAILVLLVTAWLVLFSLAWSESAKFYSLRSYAALSQPFSSASRSSIALSLIS